MNSKKSLLENYIPTYECRYSVSDFEYIRSYCVYLLELVIDKQYMLFTDYLLYKVHRGPDLVTVNLNKVVYKGIHFNNSSYVFIDLETSIEIVIADDCYLEKWFVKERI